MELTLYLVNALAYNCIAETHSNLLLEWVLGFRLIMSGDALGTVG